MNISPDQLGGLARAVLATLAGVAVGKGWIASGDAEWLVSGAVAGLIGAWSWWTNRPERLAS